jgi:uncharacterized phage infection (PIP) family protein YhgE
MIEKVVRNQLKEKEKKIEKLEAGIISLRKELEKTIDRLSRRLKFGKSIEILDNILNHPRSPFIKTSLGYNKKQKTPKKDASTKVTKPSEKENEKKKPKSYANIFKASINKESNIKKGNDDQQKHDSSHKNNKNEFKRLVAPRNPFTTRYQNLFLSYCFFLQ